MGDRTAQQLGDALVAGLPGLLDEIALLFRERWPEFARFLDSERDEVLGAVGDATRELAGRAAAATGAPPDQPLPELVEVLFTQVGATQYREGRHLSDLLAAYRLAGRVGWRHLGRVATEAGAPAPVLAALADEMFVLV